MQTLSISAEKSQKFTVTLEGVSCTIQLTQRTTGLYLDLYVGDTAVCLGVICQNANRLVRYDYLRAKSGFRGDLFFIDTQGSDDPEWSELGDRFQLCYVTSEEIS